MWCLDDWVDGGGGGSSIIKNLQLWCMRIVANFIKNMPWVIRLQRFSRRKTVSALGTESWEPVDLNIALNEGSSMHVNGWKVDVIQVKRASSNGSFVSLEIHELNGPWHSERPSWKSLWACCRCCFNAVVEDRSLDANQKNRQVDVNTIHRCLSSDHSLIPNLQVPGSGVVR